MASNKFCSQCGQKVLGECLNSNCQQHWQNFWEKKVKIKINDYQSEINLLKSSEINTLNLENYRELKKIKNKVQEWNKN